MISPCHTDATCQEFAGDWCQVQRHGNLVTPRLRMAEIGNRELSNMKQSKQRGEHPEVPDLGGSRFCLKNKKTTQSVFERHCPIPHDFGLPKFGLRHSRQTSDPKNS